MTRRSHTIQSTNVAGPSTPRGAGGGGATILCMSNPGLFFSGADGVVEIGPIVVHSDGDFQRIFIAATIVDVREFGGG